MASISFSASVLNEELMASVIERVELALSNAHTMNQLLARGISYSEARERLIASTFSRLTAEAGI